MAAGFVGCLDQAVAELFEGDCLGIHGAYGGVEDGFDLFVTQLAGEAVGAEEEEVAGLNFGLNEVGGDADLGAEGAGDHVAQWGAGGFGAGHAAEADLLLYQGVVLSAELDVVVAQAIAAAVADVEYPDAAVFFGHAGEQGYQRGAHAGQARVALGAGVDGVVGGDYRFFGDAGQGVMRGAAVFFAVACRVNRSAVSDSVRYSFCDAFGDQLEDFVDGERAGDFAGGGAAHSVADDVDAVFDGVAEGVFIG